MALASSTLVSPVVIRPGRRESRRVPDAGDRTREPRAGTPQAPTEASGPIPTARVDGETAPAAAEAAQAAAEAAILRRIHDDPEAFGELYDLYCDRIYEYIYRRLRDRTAAEDVTAEVFIKAMRAIDGFRPGGPPIGAWLYRIASNTVIDHVRARRSTVSLEVAPDSVDPARPVEEQAIDRVETDRVWQAVDALTGAQQLAVRLRFADDLPLAVIAARMGRTEGAVKLLLHRALAAMRVNLDVADAPKEARS